MIKLSIPEHLRKDWLLHLSGLFTWSLVTFLSLINTEMGLAFLLKSMGFLVFYVLFFIDVTRGTDNHSLRYKAFVATQTMIVLLLIYFDQYRVAPILLVLIATQLPAVFSRSQAIIAMLLTAGAHFLVIYNGKPFDSFFDVLIFFLLQIFGYSTLEIVLREQRAKEELHAINQELLATRFMLKSSSKKQERLRISRDLHDVLGHQLTALSLNLEVATHKVPFEFKPLLQQNLDQAKHLLKDVREVVKEMRQEDDFDLVDAIKAMVAQLSNCEISITGDFAIKSLALKNQLVYCLQEGISNALRHGRANNFALSYQQNEHHITITLADNGSGCSDLTIGSGLAGMKERLANFSGDISLKTNKLACVLTLQAEDNYD